MSKGTPLTLSLLVALRVPARPRVLRRSDSRAVARAFGKGRQCGLSGLGKVARSAGASPLGRRAIKSSALDIETASGLWENGPSRLSCSVGIFRLAHHLCAGLLFTAGASIEASDRGNRRGSRHRRFTRQTMQRSEHR